MTAALPPGQYEVTLRASDTPEEQLKVKARVTVRTNLKGLINSSATSTTPTSFSRP